MYLDGALVHGPKALCELQGYVYDAWRRMAEIYDDLGDKQRASALRKKAGVLFEKFNDVSGTRVRLLWYASDPRCAEGGALVLLVPLGSGLRRLPEPA